MSVTFWCRECQKVTELDLRSISKYNGGHQNPSLRESVPPSLSSGYIVIGKCAKCDKDGSTSVPLSGWTKTDLLELAYHCMGKKYTEYKYKPVRVLSHNERIGGCNVPKGTVIETEDRTPSISFQDAEQIIDRYVQNLAIIPYGEGDIRIPSHVASKFNLVKKN